MLKQCFFIFLDFNFFFKCFSYRGGVDSEGRPVMVVVGAHFLLRCLDLERFVLHVVKVTTSFSVRQLYPKSSKIYIYGA